MKKNRATIGIGLLLAAVSCREAPPQGGPSSVDLQVDGDSRGKLPLALFINGNAVRDVPGLETVFETPVQGVVAGAGPRRINLSARHFPVDRIRFYQEPSGTLGVRSAREGGPNLSGVEWVNVITKKRARPRRTNFVELVVGKKRHRISEKEWDGVSARVRKNKHNSSGRKARRRGLAVPQLAAHFADGRTVQSVRLSSGTHSVTLDQPLAPDAFRLKRNKKGHLNLKGPKGTQLRKVKTIEIVLGAS